MTKTQKTEAQEAEAPAEIRPKTHKLPESRFRVEAATVFGTHHVAPEPGTPYEALFEDHYWVHIARFLRPWSRIVVDYQGEDGSYTATLLVQDADKTGAKVVEIHKAAIETVDPAALKRVQPIYEIRYDIQRRFCVIRKADRRYMATDLATRADAERWISANMKALAA